MAVKQDIQVGLIAFIGIVGSMLLLISVWGVEAWYAYEIDVLTLQRLEIDENQEWLALKAEQYGNIGDPVGNATIYAAGMAPAQAGALPPAWGYRHPTEARDTVTVPIHVAMAAVARQHGGGEVTAEEMRQIDRRPVVSMHEGRADVTGASDPAPATRPSGSGGH